MREGLSHYPLSIELGNRNLVKAWQAGVLLVTGSDAGNFLVLHGPTVQHEIELWVAAGIPAEVALGAATAHAAKLLRADDRIGTIEKGRRRSLLVVDGNPLQDVRALSSISNVFLKASAFSAALCSSRNNVGAAFRAPNGGPPAHRGTMPLATLTPQPNDSADE